MSPCLIYTGPLNYAGYGVLRVEGKLKRAHRVVYEEAYGPIPDGMVIRHNCDVRSCVNLKHLEIGTQKDNVADRVARGRSAVGLNNGRAKVTPEMITIIKNSQESAYKLALELGVSHSAVRDVRQGKTSLSVSLGLTPVPNAVGSKEYRAKD